MKIGVFLLPATSVVPTLARDYPEWHKGRTAFSLWYLELHSHALQNYLEQLRAEFSDVLFQPNTRQFHITVFICGFYSASSQFDDDFTDEQLKQQLLEMQKAQLQPFKLRTGKINSFESALFVEIHDDERGLEKVRQQLYACTNEIAPISYCPHITLGLYGTALNSDEIFKRIERIGQQSFEFEILQLTFGTYTAHQLQGPLSAQLQYTLGTL